MNSRQYNLLKHFINRKDEFLIGSQLAITLDISTRTLQSEIANLKKELSTNGAEIRSMAGRGYQLVITDSKKFNEYMSLYENSRVDNNDSDQRVHLILRYLLSSSYIKSEDLYRKLFISASTFSSDLKTVKEILKKYKLSTISKPHYGMHVSGKEQDIRLCLVKEVIAKYPSIAQFAVSVGLSFDLINDITAESLIENSYKISDLTFQSLIMYVMACIIRNRNDSHITDLDENNIVFMHEFTVAKTILKKLSLIYHFSFTNGDINDIAQTIIGKRYYDNEELITVDSQEIVNGMLKHIKDKTGVDFAWDVELRLSLALHIMPMQIRATEGFIPENDLTYTIKANYLYAYEIATIATAYLSDIFHYMFGEEEISYLALHFNISLDKMKVNNRPKKVLVLCSSRRANSLLLRYNLYKHFGERFSGLNIQNIYEATGEFDDYDIIFSTTLNSSIVPKNAILINYFLTDKDYQKIDMALSGIKGSDFLSSFFKEDLFISELDANNKEEVIKAMCQHCLSRRNVVENFYDLTMEREKFGATAFHNMIALPHPDHSTSEKLFVTVAILKEAILWGDLPVQLVLLISPGEDIEEIRNFFNIISSFISEGNIVEQIIEKRSFSFFISSLIKLV